MASGTTPKLLYRPKEAAETLSLSRTQVYNLMNRGEIASFRVDGMRMITREELEAFVERLRREQGLYTPSEHHRRVVAARRDRR